MVAAPGIDARNCDGLVPERGARPCCNFGVKVSRSDFPATMIDLCLAPFIACTPEQTLYKVDA
jgi:hypothetical protein